jgi:hypothetical protein
MSNDLAKPDTLLVVSRYYALTLLFVYGAPPLNHQIGKTA